MSGAFQKNAFQISAFQVDAGVIGVAGGPGWRIDHEKRAAERVQHAEEIREEIRAILAGPIEAIEPEGRTVETVMALPAVAELQYPRAQIAEILAAVLADEEDEEEAVMLLLAA